MRKLLDKLTSTNNMHKWYYGMACKVWWWLYTPFKGPGYTNHK